MKNIKAFLLLTSITGLLLVGCQKNESTSIDESIDVTDDEVTEVVEQEEKEDIVEEDVEEHIETIMLTHNLNPINAYFSLDQSSQARTTFENEILSKDEMRTKISQLNEIFNKIIDHKNNQLKDEPYTLIKPSTQTELTYTGIEVRDGDYIQANFDLYDSHEYSRLQIIDKQVDQKFYDTFNIGGMAESEVIRTMDDEIQNLNVGDEFPWNAHYKIFENDQYIIGYIPLYESTPDVIESEDDLIQTQNFVDTFKTDEMIALYEELLAP